MNHKLTTYAGVIVAAGGLVASFATVFPHQAAIAIALGAVVCAFGKALQSE
jgi:hypothetical protein